MYNKDSVDKLIKVRGIQRKVFIILGAVTAGVGFILFIMSFLFGENASILFNLLLYGIAFIVIGSILLIVQYSVIETSRRRYISMWNKEIPGIESTSDFEIK